MNTATIGRPRLEEDELLIKHSAPLFAHLEERAGIISMTVENTLAMYLEERTRLSVAFAEGIKDRYWQSGLYFRVQRRTLHRKPYPTFDLCWAVGRVINNDPKYPRKRNDMDRTITDKVHRCENENGEYSLNNIRAACRGKAQFEYQLAYEYEKVLRPLRADLRSISALIRGVVDCGAPPDIDDALDAMPELGVAKSIERWTKAK